MHDLPDHPIIRNLERTGYPDGKEPRYPHCPVTVTTNASDAMAAYKPKTHGKSKIASRKGAEMPKFYFTYGTDGQPFVGGWTEVEAPDRRAACAAFRSYHPDKTEGLLNCSSVYDEAWFKQTEMYRNGNFGVRCHERITLRREDANN